MEVSSQGLKLHRTAGIRFDIGIFTNLAPDHIGENEHASFEEYMECKSRLFRQCDIGIVNADDEHCSDILKGHTCKVETYGFSEKADLRASDLKLVNRPGFLGVDYHVSGLLNFDVEIDMPGRFSVYNSLVAIAVCRHFDIPKEDMLAALEVVQTKGRIEKVKVSDDFTLMIDYAHNAMSLESLLTTLKEYNLLQGGKYVEIIDRKEAIRYVIENGRPGDVIVLAGKGHEDYQEICGVKHPMDERVLIAEVLEELGRK